MTCKLYGQIDNTNGPEQCDCSYKNLIGNINDFTIIKYDPIVDAESKQIKKGEEIGKEFTWIYDSNNKLVKRILYANSDSPVSETIIKYNKDGLKERSISYENNDTIINKIFYNKYKKETSWKTLKNNVLMSKIENIYLNDSILKSNSTIFYDKDVVDLMIIEKFEYFNQGDSIIKKTFRDNVLSEKNITSTKDKKKETYLIDKNDELSMYISETYNQLGLVKHKYIFNGLSESYETFTYDLNNNLIEIRKTDKNNILKELRIFTYDKQGSFVSDTWKSYSDGEVFNSSKTKIVYEYDERGNWINCIKFLDFYNEMKTPYTYSSREINYRN
ncbi:hypothetical protein [Aquimarina sp. AU58]|uniref:hypothetical protein n=1 Tax=Aquimarina sp. AU58 TaxID=1874112 RepID=UPI0013579751|nr:hypothetical protein [Aquimarina sp. AU58]